MKKASFIIIVLLVVVVGVYFFGPLVDKKAEAPVGDTLVTDEENSRNLISASKTALIGLWRSKDDARFTREFRADGSAEDKYDNGGSFDRTMLSWSVFSEKYPDSEFNYPYEDGAAYLRMDNGEYNLFFKIIKITPEELELTYMDRGGMLIFTREN